MTKAFEIGYLMGKQADRLVPDEEVAQRLAEGAFSATKLYPGWWGQSPDKTIRGRKRLKRIALLKEQILAAKNRQKVKELIEAARAETPRQWRKTLKAYDR